MFIENFSTQGQSFELLHSTFTRANTQNVSNCSLPLRFASAFCGVFLILVDMKSSVRITERFTIGLPHFGTSPEAFQTHP